MLDIIPRPTFSARAFGLVTVAALLGGGMMIFGSSPSLAATQTLTGTSSPGVLSITAPGSLTLPTLVNGSSTAATSLGSLSWTDTLNDATVSSVTLAATNLWHAAGAGLYIPWADFTITVDQSPTAGGLNTGSAAVAGPATEVLTGTPTTDFGTYSTPITLATASATSEGTWTQANNQITISVPANTTASTLFSATIQYTITG
ncbi:MAG: hypothetical protein WAL64_09390 [Candidatus Dormiibacterota bacterium]